MEMMDLEDFPKAVGPQGLESSFVSLSGLSVGIDSVSLIIHAFTVGKPPYGIVSWHLEKWNGNVILENGSWLLEKPIEN